MTIQDQEAITPQTLINIRPITAAIKNSLVAHNYHNSWIKQTHYQN